MQNQSNLPPHANGWAKNEVTGDIRAVQIKNGRCFYWGGEETEIIELGPIDLTAIERTQSPGYFGDCLQWYHQPHGERNTKWQGIDWVICGGESGPNARPMRPYWVRTLRNQCYAADVPFLFKQWGEWAPNCFLLDDGTRDESREWMERMGKKSAGRLLDGEIYNEFPEVNS